MASFEFSTVTQIDALKPPSEGGFYEASDANKETKALRVRVSSASKVFYMNARWKKGASSSTSRAIGFFTKEEREERNEDGDKVYVTLAEAREQVREWDKLRRAGIDPAEKLRAAREAKERADREAEAAAEARAAGIFRNVVEEYLASPEFRALRSAAKVGRQVIRAELLNPKRNPWLERHISEIEDADVVSLVAAIRDRPARWKGGRVRHKGCPTQALHTFEQVRKIFAWSVSLERRKRYGLKFNAIQHLKSKDCGLKKKPRQHLLVSDEIRAYWNAAGKMAYPWGPFFRLLLVTGQRLSEILQASWPEIDRADAILRIPPERFKSGVAHPVPLSDLALEIVEGLPRFDGGPFLFSMKNGRAPATAIGKAKGELNALILAELRELASERGEPEPEALRGFVNHDLRRVVRSQLSSLRVADTVAELIIGHGKKGLARVYDQHAYADEMRDGLQRWADRLRAIVNPPSGSNVVMMKRVS